MTPEVAKKPISTIALDGDVKLDALSARLGWPEERRYAYGTVRRLEGGERLFIFDFGAVVQDGADKIDAGVLAAIEAATDRRAMPQTAETYYVNVDKERAGGAARVGWDQVIIPERTHGLTAAMALLIGQSAALERYEAGAERALDEAMSIARRLRERGRPPWASRVHLRQIGHLAEYRLELANLFYFLDRPEETWDDPGIASLYDDLFKNLELGERHRATLEKLETVENIYNLVINLWQGRVNNRLEWAIVLLIVAEIVLTGLKIM